MDKSRTNYESSASEKKNRYLQAKLNDASRTTGKDDGRAPSLWFIYFFLFFWKTHFLTARSLAALLFLLGSFLVRFYATSTPGWHRHRERESLPTWGDPAITSYIDIYAPSWRFDCVSSLSSSTVTCGWRERGPRPTRERRGYYVIVSRAILKVFYTRPYSLAKTFNLILLKHRGL